MTSKIKLYLISFVFAALAFFTGYYAAKGSHGGKNATKNYPIVATNGTVNYRFLNPFSELIKAKGMRMDEIRSFRPQLEAYIANTLSTFKGKNVMISYYFRDLNNGMWIGLGEKELFSPASLMKVPTMIAVLKEAQDHPEILDKTIQFRAAAFEHMDEESGFGKEDQHFYTIRELLDQSIQWSDNAATLMLMNFVGMEKVIKVEDDMNLHVASNFTEQTNFVSVKNYAGIFRILYNCSYMNEDMSEKALEILSDSKFTEGIRRGIPADIKIAHKYGERDIRYEDGVREAKQLHHFGIVYYPSKPFLIGVMTKGDISKAEKEKIISDLARMTYEAVNAQMMNSKPERNEKFLQAM